MVVSYPEGCGARQGLWVALILSAVLAFAAWVPTADSPADPNLADTRSAVSPTDADGWFEWLNPVPTGNHLRAVAFSGPDEAWAVGDAGAVIKLTSTSVTPIQDTSFEGVHLRDVHFSEDGETGLIVGMNGAAVLVEEGQIIPVTVAGSANLLAADRGAHTVAVGGWYDASGEWQGAIYRLDGTALVLTHTAPGWFMTDIAFDQSGSTALIVGYNGLIARWSPTGVTLLRTGTESFVSVCFIDADRALIVGRDGSSVIAEEGMFYDAGLPSSGIVYNSVVSRNGSFVAAARHGYVEYGTATDHAPVNGLVDWDVNGVAWGEAGVFLVGERGGVLYWVPPDPADSIPLSHGTFENLFGVASVEEGYIACGAGGALLLYTPGCGVTDLTIGSGIGGIARAVARNPDGTAVVAASNGLWAWGGSGQSAVRFADGDFTRMAVSEGGNGPPLLFASGPTGALAGRWDASIGGWATQAVSVGGTPSALAAAPDGFYLGYADGMYSLWTPGSGEVAVDTLDHGIVDLVFDPVHGRLWAALDDGTVLEKSARGESVHPFPAGTSLRAIALDPSGHLLIGVGAGGSCAGLYNGSFESLWVGTFLRLNDALIAADGPDAADAIVVGDKGTFIVKHGLSVPRFGFDVELSGPTHVLAGETIAVQVTITSTASVWDRAEVTLAGAIEDAYLLDLDPSESDARTFAIADVPVGELAVTVQAISQMDPDLMVEAVYSVDVEPPNTPPRFVSEPLLDATEDEPYAYAVLVEDDDGDEIFLEAQKSPAGMSLERTHDGFEINWIPENADVGSHVVSLRAWDGLEPAFQNFTVTVSNVNDAPAFLSNPPIQVLEDTDYVYMPQVHDVDVGDEVNVWLEVGPLGMTFCDGVLRWTPDQTDVGLHEVVLLASDLAGAVVEQSFELSVENSNDPPVFASDPPLVATEGRLWVYAPVVTDQDGDDVDIFLVEGPSGMVLVDGLLSWTPPDPDLVVSSHVILAATDGILETEQSFDLQIVDVNEMPIPYIDILPPMIGDFSLDARLSAQRSHDPDGVIVSYAWEMGDGTLLNGMLVHHSYAASGVYMVVLTVVDDAGASSERVIELAINHQRVLSEDSRLRVTLESISCAFHNEVGMDAPLAMVIFPDVHTSLGATVDLGTFEAGSELVFYLKSPNGTRYLSSDPRRCLITKVSDERWLYLFEDWQDFDWNDVLFSVEIVPDEPSPGPPLSELDPSGAVHLLGDCLMRATLFSVCCSRHYEVRLLDPFDSPLFPDVQYSIGEIVEVWPMAQGGNVILALLHVDGSLYRTDRPGWWHVIDLGGDRYSLRFDDPTNGEWDDILVLLEFFPA